MIKRTTIEIDEDLLARAKRVLGESTTRGTVEEALRRVAHTAEIEQQERIERQRRFFEHFSDHIDLDMLASEDMWR